MAATTAHPSRTGNQAGQAVRDAEKQVKHITNDLVQYLTDYAREKPEHAALWCLGIGFVLGWKLKPW